MALNQSLPLSPTNWSCSPWKQSIDQTLLLPASRSSSAIVFERSCAASSRSSHSTTGVLHGTERFRSNWVSAETPSTFSAKTNLVMCSRKSSTALGSSSAMSWKTSRGPSSGPPESKFPDTVSATGAVVGSERESGAEIPFTNAPLKPTTGMIFWLTNLPIEPNFPIHEAGRSSVACRCVIFECE